MAILPAGRPGEVAKVEGVPAATVEAIVAAANLPYAKSIDEKLFDVAIGALEVERGLHAATRARLDRAEALLRRVREACGIEPMSPVLEDIRVFLAESPDAAEKETP